MTDPAIQNIRIEELDLSVRTYACLRRVGIKTVGDLMKMSGKEILKIRNLGKKGLEELQRMFAELEIEFKSSEE